jgi:hypothetical protein
MQKKKVRKYYPCTGQKAVHRNQVLGFTRKNKYVQTMKGNYL